MSNFKVDGDRRVFLDGVEIERCTGFIINVDAGTAPEVHIKVSVDSIDVDGYTDMFTKQTEQHF